MPPNSKTGAVATAWHYDASGLLTNTSYSDGTASVGNGYDRRGRLVAITNGSMVSGKGESPY